jgi:hypothetical protein
MRAREFVSESSRGTLDHALKNTAGSLITSGNKETFYDGRSYDAYRIGMLTGMHPDDLEKSDVHSWVGNMALYNPYTPEEHDKIARAMKKMGHSVKQHAPGGSHEPPDTHKVSPVSQFKGYAR